MNKTKLKYVLLIILVALAIGLFFLSKLGNKLKEGSDQHSLSDVKESWKSDCEDALNGKYSNLNVISLDTDIYNIQELYEIDIENNKDYENKTNKENLDYVDQIVGNYFNNDFDMSIVNVTYFDTNGESKEIPYSDFTNQVNDNTLSTNSYFLLFGDNRETGKKGFLQIDSGISQIWFSKGNIPATLPMYSYDVKKIYNLTICKDRMDDVIKLSNGKITIRKSIEFVEDYLNNNLPYKKNKDFTYEVAEVRVLDVDGQDALGFCVRKKYNNISFDYVDGLTDGIYNSDYWDDRGEICMIKTDEIDNLCGLGGDTYSVKRTSNKINEIISLSSALKMVSDEIGDNSVYDVYGVELVYQFKEADGLDKYKGNLVWKIITKNQNDDKDTWFYVDIETGEISYRYKMIYGR